MSLTRDTIYALSSGGLPSGVAIVRVSGPACRAVMDALCGSIIEARTPALRWIRKSNGDPIDQGLVMSFPGPNSFTGEDCVEFQVHGGRAVVDALLGELSGFEGLRHAEAGEFSRRAFDNGKLDLVEIEGLADLISAETEMQRRLAIEQTRGALSDLYTGWAEKLTRIRALIEAELDFPDEDDVPGAVSDRLQPELADIARQMRDHLSGQRAGEIIRDGFRIAIVGRPNAGKSSLLNALARRDVAIVTSVAGTTRDVIGVDLDIGGYLVHVMDTAGLRETDDIVEQEGVRRAMRSIEDADLVLVLKGADDQEDFPALGKRSDALYVLTKADLLESGAVVDESLERISTLTGGEFDSLTKRILQRIDVQTHSATNLVPVRQRQIGFLAQAVDNIDETLSFWRYPLELRAELLRRSAHALGKITGTVDVEDLLGVIFSEFCIGK